MKRILNSVLSDGGSRPRLRKMTQTSVLTILAILLNFDTDYRRIFLFFLAVVGIKVKCLFSVTLLLLSNK